MHPSQANVCSLVLRHRYQVPPEEGRQEEEREKPQSTRRKTEGTGAAAEVSQKMNEYREQAVLKKMAPCHVLPQQKESRTARCPSCSRERFPETAAAAVRRHAARRAQMRQAETAFSFFRKGMGSR